MTTQPTSPVITCCGGAFHEITVQTSGSTLSLYRCTSCDRQQWTCDGEPVGREAALERLASAYRKIPVARRPVADEAAVERRQHRAQARAKQDTAPPPPEQELVDLLAGWTVLGSPS